MGHHGLTCATRLCHCAQRCGAPLDWRRCRSGVLHLRAACIKRDCQRSRATMRDQEGTKRAHERLSEESSESRGEQLDLVWRKPR
eukprot:530034-Alexandrium_andersonii.AAC.1